MNLNMIIPAIILGFIVVFSNQYAFAQSLNITASEPCFLNYTRGIHIWEDCGMGDDWLQTSLIGFEWVTGGWFSMILASVLILFTYIKYHKAIYPLLVGIAFLPFTYFLYPDQWWNFILPISILAVATALYKIYKNQTSEFN